MSNNSHYLYALNNRLGAINAFQIEADGSLTSVAGVTGLPAGMVGIAAR